MFLTKILATFFLWECTWNSNVSLVSQVFIIYVYFWWIKTFFCSLSFIFLFYHFVEIQICLVLCQAQQLGNLQEELRNKLKGKDSLIFSLFVSYFVLNFAHYGPFGWRGEGGGVDRSRVELVKINSTNLYSTNPSSYYVLF